VTDEDGNVLSFSLGASVGLNQPHSAHRRGFRRSWDRWWGIQLQASRTDE